MALSPDRDPGRLYDNLASTASRLSRSSALTFWRPGGDSITYTFEHLFARVEEIGERLASRYDVRTAPLGILVSSQESQVLHYLAGLYAGVVPAILTPPNRKLNRQYYEETMNEVLRRCRFGAIVSEYEGVEAISRVFEPFTMDLHRSAPAESAGIPGADPLDASFMQFSSGTTGIKRGVLVDDRAVMSQLLTYSQALGLDESDVIVSWLPLYHDMGFMACLNMPLFMGVHSVMIDPIYWVTDPVSYLKAVTMYGGTLSWHPNFAFMFMAQRVTDPDLRGVDLRSLRGLINCSEPTTQESQDAFLSRFGPLGLASDVFHGCYAMAETTFALTHGRSDDPGYVDSIGPYRGDDTAGSSSYLSVGRPLSGVQIRVMDPDEWTELSERSIGEIWVRAPFNFTGYYNDEEATEAAFVDGWYRTGDLGYRVGEDLFIAGRLKDVMIVGGVNVFPQDLEDIVSSVPGIQPGRVAAFSSFDERTQTERITILAETAQTTSRRADEAIVEVRQRILAALQVTGFDVHLVHPGWLVKSTSGKVARSANREKWIDESQSVLQS